MSVYVMGALWIMNIVTLLISGWDKLAAKQYKRRVPEKVLMGFTTLGGSLGMLISMVWFRHKTGKPLFRIGVPVILLMQLAGASWWAFWSMG